MTGEILQGEEHFKNYLLEIPCSHAKMRLKIAQSQKLNFEMAKAL